MTIKSKKRVHDHGEVFTPDFIVNNMLDLVMQETERIDSRFLEPACGDGNFLIEVLRRKLEIVKKKYKKSQFDFEKYSLAAIGSIYGVELLDDNRESAIERLYNFIVEEYKNLYKAKINKTFLKNIRYVLERNILQGNALDLKNKEGKLIVFSEWSLIGGSKIKRRDFQFIDLTESENKENDLFHIDLKSDLGQDVFIPESIKEYPAVNFMELYKSYE